MAGREKQKAEVRKAARAARGPNATLKHLRMSPRKVRLIIDLIRGRSVEEALNVLTFSDKAAAEPVGKLLKSAVANADNRGGFDLDRLYVKTAFVDEGLTWKRWLPRAQGRATRIRKRTSHVTIELAERG
ncbi:MAG: 50S ribosomal protein L22 [Myxococcota bacterium]